MTSEDEFQALLDANPKDYQTRLVFADWLQERNDPRAEGYRALGLLRREPYQCTMHSGDYHGKTIYVYGSKRHTKAHRLLSAGLDGDWIRGVPRTHASDTHWVRYLSRRSVEDAAALAFVKLPPERRAELLAGPTTARKKPTRAKAKKKPTKPKKPTTGKKK